MRDVIIIGAGTAGLTAAIYAKRAGKDVLVLESKMYGGQIVNATDIENYPGIKNISGFDFATGLYEQAIKQGTEIEYEKVVEIKVGEEEHIVVTDINSYKCKRIIIATGAKNRPLGIENEEEFIGRGISYCATCDGAFYKGKNVAIVGGGNTALEDAVYLSEYCNKVYLIHRRDSFRGEQHIVDILKNKENVTFIMNSSVIAIECEQVLKAVKVQNNITNEENTIDVEGLFIAIGQTPATEMFSNVVKLDEKGYIIAGEDCFTGTKGIYVAGDCRTKQVRQLTTAAADGAVAGLKASET